MPTACGLAVALACATGCTWLITFDEIPLNPVGDGDASTRPAPLDAQGDAPAAPPQGDAGLAQDAADASDRSFTTLRSCVGMANGRYCGNNQIRDYPGSKDDLVTCEGGAVVAIKACQVGVGCVRMPNPQPDECDECAAKSDGFYCGRDMAGWSAANANRRVRCQAGGLVDTSPCPNGCTSNHAVSVCK